MSSTREFFRSFSIGVLVVALSCLLAAGLTAIADEDPGGLGMCAGQATCSKATNPCVLSTTGCGGQCDTTISGCADCVCKRTTDNSACECVL